MMLSPGDLQGTVLVVSIVGLNIVMFELKRFGLINKGCMMDRGQGRRFLCKSFILVCRPGFNGATKHD